MAGEGLPQGLGRLFADGGAGRVLDVDLPPGRLVVPPGGEAGAGPAYWLSDEPASPDLWVALHRAHARSGLWPLLTPAFDSRGDLPLLTGDVRPQPASDIDLMTPAEAMDRLWSEWIDDAESDEEDFSYLAPFGRGCPGLAPAASPGPEPGDFADQYVRDHEDGTSCIALVAAARGADVVTVTGWQGTVNYGEDIVALSAMLRSWEDRFGARLIKAGFDTLILSVAAPPTGREHAEQVAAEHFACCVDNILQGQAETIGDYAEARVRRQPVWSFWWD